jgi:hypothetical protein
MKLASQRVPEIFAEVSDRLEPFGEDIRFREVFGSLEERCSSEEWAERLAEHHHATQKRKPPDGKSPWFHRCDNGTYIINPLYRREQGGRHDDSYVHAYHTRSLRLFALDLKLL